MFKFERKILDNGLRVILAPMENTEAVTIQVLVGIGSKNETKNINGISHFLEHLFFKGTKSRPNLGDVNVELDRIGATHNAFTTKEETGFWVKSSLADFDVGLDIVSDILLESLFKEKEIEKEKGVILEEINMYEDNYPRKVFEILFEVMYGDQPAGWPALGTKKSVKNINRSDILNYMENNYVGENMLIVVAGGIDALTAFEKIKKSFKKLKRGRIAENVKTTILQEVPQLKLVKKDIDQSHFIIGVRAFDMYDERRYSLAVLSNILGEKASSRLFLEMREKLGLAYYSWSGISLQKDEGILFVRAGVSHDNLEKAVDRVCEILTDLRQNGVTKKELEDAKSHARGQMALNFETSDQVADFYGEQELFYKKIMQPEEILKKIEKVSQYDILKVARDIFRPEKINMAVIGQHEDNEKNQELFKKIFFKI